MMDTFSVTSPLPSDSSARYASSQEASAEKFLLYLWRVSRDPMPMAGNAYTLSQWKAAKEDAESLSQLEHDWDGHGGDPVTKSALNNTIRFLNILENWTPSIPIPDISPTPHGTISLGWEVGSIEACIEIGNTRYSGYIRIGGHPPALFEGRTDDKAHAHNFFASSLSTLIVQMRYAGLSSITSVPF